MSRLVSFTLAILSLGAGGILTGSLMYLGALYHLPHLSLPFAALLTGLFAMLIAWRLLASWWRPVLFFLPLATVLSFTINPWWFLAGAILLIALQWNAVFTRIPLYRSDKMVGESLSHFMDTRGYRSLLDIGCGEGRLLSRLARAHPERNYVGIESAPVLYLLAYWRCRKLANCQIKYGDFWKISWEPYDVVFAFLSPEPMLWVWRKAERDMHENSALLSLAFSVPGIEEDDILPAQQFDLFLYQHRTRKLHEQTGKKNDSNESV